LEKDTCRDYVLPRLEAAGWSDAQIQEQFPITDGRIIAVGKKHRRGDALRADYVLEYQPGMPVAVVEAKREYAIPGKGLQQAKNYGQLLDLPFAYSTNGKGIVEDDRDTGLETDELVAFPSPEELWSRYRAWKGIVDDAVSQGIVLPFSRALRNADSSVKEPRYYQRTAINRSVRAILSGDKRLLLTMATGTGKTFVSMQIVWKLWKSGWRPGRNPRILYLADRNILIDQPRLDYFVPAFGGRPGLDPPRRRSQGGARDLLRAVPGARRWWRGLDRDVPGVRPRVLRPRDSRRVPSRQRQGRIVVASDPGPLFGRDPDRDDGDPEA
jgi:type I restriction enzyme R subunit